MENAWEGYKGELHKAKNTMDNFWGESRGVRKGKEKHRNYLAGAPGRVTESHEPATKTMKHQCETYEKPM